MISLSAMRGNSRVATISARISKTLICSKKVKLAPYYNVRNFASSSNENENDDGGNSVIYEGPFASLSLRLKRISFTSACASIAGIPLLFTLQTNIPPSGQIAVGGTAILAACGSTAALNFCFGPYVEKLEWIPVRQCSTSTPSSSDKEGEDNNVNDDKSSQEDLLKSCGQNMKMLLKATTRGYSSMQSEVVFNPFSNSSNISFGKDGTLVETDKDADADADASTSANNDIDAGTDSTTSTDYEVVHHPQSYRPFCNFIAKGKPLFVHPDLVHDEQIRMLLLGHAKVDLESSTDEDKKTAAGNNKKDPDDEFL
uniref:Uncharacterized protein n=1 Tax=Chaetoceros debilis TaxID=122233 RepID=A0A7S3Q9W9_9STRA